MQDQDPREGAPVADVPALSPPPSAPLGESAMPAPQGMLAAQPPAGVPAQAGQGGYREWGASDRFADEPPAGTNGKAIAALILAVVGGGVLSVTFGAIAVLVVTVLSVGLSIAALSQIRWSGQRGRGMAVAALVVSGGWLLVVVSFLLMPSDTPVAEDPAVNRAMRGTSLTPGDCLRSFGDTADAGAPSVVPCSDPHTAEVYTVFTFPDGPYPGDAEIEGEIEKRCTRSFQPYLTGNESLNLSSLRPSSSSWLISRQVACIAVDPAGTRTGSLVG